MEAAAWLVAGLGNPGDEYADNRHNVGFMVLDTLASRWGVPVSAFRSKFGSLLAQADCKLGGDRYRVHLQKPMQYMNVSGGPVQGAMAFFRIPPANLIVIHDEIDLPFQRLRVKIGGGHGGHNGLRDIIKQLGSPEFARIRVGIGRPVHGDVADYVLSNFAGDDAGFVPALVDRAADALTCLLAEGLASAMNLFNRSANPPS